MKLFIRSLITLIVLSGLNLPLTAQPSRYVEGTHYVELEEAVRTSDPEKVEVVEVFWYGCNHCYAFEPLIQDWEQSLPEDVVFVRSPGMWNDMMETHARLYYTAVALGVFEQVHDEIYDEIQVRGNYLQNEQQAREFFTEAGVPGEDFDSTWDSFSVTANVNRARSRMAEYGVRGVPTLIVDGKYRVSVGQAVPTQADMLSVVDFLVEMERNN